MSVHSEVVLRTGTFISRQILIQLQNEPIWPDRFLWRAIEPMLPKSARGAARLRPPDAQRRLLGAAIPVRHGAIFQRDEAQAPPAATALCDVWRHAIGDHRYFPVHIIGTGAAAMPPRGIQAVCRDLVEDDPRGSPFGDQRSPSFLNPFSLLFGIGAHRPSLFIAATDLAIPATGVRKDFNRGRHLMGLLPCNLLGEIDDL